MPVVAGRGVGSGTRGSDIGHGWFTHVPLAHAGALMTLNYIEIDVHFVMAVGTGTRHSGETIAGTFA